MKDLKLPILWKGKSYHVDLSKGHCIAIPLDHTKPQVSAFHAPLFEATPHKMGDWVGDTREGAPVNFFNLRLNPHGNGTHTECVGHIAKERYSIHQSLGDGFFVTQLISVYPSSREEGDRVIDQLEWEEGMEAIIIRTLPNHPDKKSRQYAGTNPPYLDAKVVRHMAEKGIMHLLLDLPSVDREEDGGALAAHKAFWIFDKDIRMDATISELVYIDDIIPDGLYLLQIQLPALELDAAPSRPYIYPLQ